MRFSDFALVSILVIAACTPAPATNPAKAAESQLQAIIDEHWDYSLRENPLMATQAGVSDYNDRLPVSIGKRNTGNPWITLRALHTLKLCSAVLQPA